MAKILFTNSIPGNSTGTRFNPGNPTTYAQVKTDLSNVYVPVVADAWQEQPAKGLRIKRTLLLQNSGKSLLRFFLRNTG